MKKSVFLALILAGVLCLTACDSGSTSSSPVTQSGSTEESIPDPDSYGPSDILKSIQEQVEFPGMADTTNRMEQFYDLGDIGVQEFAGAICGSGAYPDEVAIFWLQNVSDAEAVKAVLEQRVATVTSTFENYTPDEMYKLDGNNIHVKGRCVALIISPDNKKATEIWDSMTFEWNGELTE